MRLGEVAGLDGELGGKLGVLLLQLGELLLKLLALDLICKYKCISNTKDGERERNTRGRMSSPS